MDKYIKQIEKLVEQKLNNALKPKGKGLLAPKKTKLKDSDNEQQQSTMDLVANFIADIRMKRMEYRKTNGKVNG